MAKRNVGYLLPDGDAYTDELACMMLFYPDKPEYRQALFGALDFFGTWLAWEKEPEHKGKDAALAWSEAIALTRDCIDMNTCETMLELLTEIRNNTGIYCCDVVDVSDGDQYTDEVEDGVGDVPQNIIDAGYADDAADWDGFDDYKCMIAHLMIENIQAQVAKIESFMLPTGAMAGGVVALAAIMAAILTGGAAILVYGIVVAIGLTSVVYAALALIGEAGMSDLVDDLVTHYDALVCSIYEADGSAAAVVALKDEIDELFNPVPATILKALNLPVQLKALYNGRYDQQDIAEILADDGYDLGDYTCVPCGAEPLDVGTNLEMVNVVGVNAYGSGSTTWIIHNVDEEYANGVEVDVTHEGASGHHFYVELDLQESAYHADPDVSFRGLTYLAFHTATGTEQDHRADAGAYVQVAYPCGYGRRTSWTGLHSDPHGSFQAECEAILENTYADYSGTDGLDLLPDQTRKILLRFTVNGIQRYFVRIHTMYWAIDYQP